MSVSIVNIRSVVKMCVIMMSNNGECHKQARYAECHYVEFSYEECRGTYLFYTISIDKLECVRRSHANLMFVSKAGV